MRGAGPRDRMRWNPDGVSSRSAVNTAHAGAPGIPQGVTMSARIAPPDQIPAQIPARRAVSPALMFALEFAIALVLALALLAPAATAQERDPHPFTPRTLGSYLPAGARHVSYGPSVAFGGGTARTYVVSVGGATIEVGILLSREALVARKGQRSSQTALPLPSGDSARLRHVALTWTPGRIETARTPDATRFGVQLCTSAAPADRASVDGMPATGCRAGAYSVRWESAGRQLRIALTSPNEKA